ncbi:MAG TPA: hypothetical protein VLA24_09445 [Pseudomonadales bacterium]|nr:hypothetical protein [Pseudomonadales bacterium]
MEPKIDFTKATTSPHMQQRATYDETGISTKWMVQIIHPDLPSDLFLGGDGGHYEFDTIEEARERGTEWEAKQKGESTKGNESWTPTTK